MVFYKISVITATVVFKLTPKILGARALVLALRMTHEKGKYVTQGKTHCCYQLILIP